MDVGLLVLIWNGVSAVGMISSLVLVIVWRSGKEREVDRLIHLEALLYLFLMKEYLLMVTII
jgi:hypothetical protein